MQINCTVLIDRDSGNKRKSVISIYHKVLTSNVLRPKWNGNKVVYRKSSQAQICWYFFFQWFKEEFASLNIFTHNLPQSFCKKIWRNSLDVLTKMQEWSFSITFTKFGQIIRCLWKGMINVGLRYFFKYKRDLSLHLHYCSRGRFEPIRWKHRQQ